MYYMVHISQVDESRERMSVVSIISMRIFELSSFLMIVPAGGAH